MAFPHFPTLYVICRFAISSSSLASSTKTSKMAGSSKSKFLLLERDMGTYKPEMHNCKIAEKEDTCHVLVLSQGHAQACFSSDLVWQSALPQEVQPYMQYCAKPQGTHVEFCSLRTAEITFNYHTTQK